MRRTMWALAGWLGASAVLAGTIVVDQNHAQATDDGPGSTDRPFKTISAAVKNLQPGDTVTVRKGVYREQVLIETNGTAEAPITVQAARGERVVVSGADLVTGWQKAGLKDSKGRDRPIWSKAPFPAWQKLKRDALGRGPGPQLIVDGVLCREVAGVADLLPGTFCYDPENEGMILLWLHPPRRQPGGR